MKRSKMLEILKDRADSVQSPQLNCDIVAEYEGDYMDTAARFIFELEKENAELRAALKKAGV